MNSLPLVAPTTALLKCYLMIIPSTSELVLIQVSFMHPSFLEFLSLQTQEDKEVGYALITCFLKFS